MTHIRITRTVVIEGEEEWARQTLKFHRALDAAYASGSRGKVHEEGYRTEVVWDKDDVLRQVLDFPYVKCATCTRRLTERELERKESRGWCYDCHPVD